LLSWVESIKRYDNAVIAQQSKLFGVLDAPQALWNSLGSATSSLFVFTGSVADLGLQNPVL